MKGFLGGSSTRLWPFFSEPHTRQNGSQLRALLRDYRGLENFVMFTSPPDFTEFLHSTGPPLPDLQGLHSQMAKVEFYKYDQSQNVEIEFVDSEYGLRCLKI